MQMWLVVLRTLIGVPLFLYIPGLLVDRLWRGATEVSGVERQAMHVVVSLLLTGWIALVLAEIGVFGFWTLAIVVLGLCAIGAWRLRHRVRWSVPSGIIAGRNVARIDRAGVQAARFDLLLFAVLIVFGVLVARPFEVIRGGLDAGVYANTGSAIARTGGIVQHDPIVAEIGRRAAQGDVDAQQFIGNTLGTQNPVRYLATRLRASGFFINAGELASGRVVPQFFHLWPVWIAVFVSMLGPALGLVATGAAGLLGVALIGLIGRRIGGGLVGILAALFLALMTPQVWFSRMTTSEALAQALTLAGIWAFLRFADTTDRRARIWWGAITGAAFGELILTRIDVFWAAFVLIAMLIYVALTRRWHAGYTALTATLGGLLIHAALHALVIARAYVIDTGLPTMQKYALTIYAAWPLLSDEIRAYTIVRPNSRIGDWPRLALELGIVALLIVAAIGVWRWRRVFNRIEGTIVRRRRALIGLVVIGLGALAIYGYLIRPQILTAAALRDPIGNSLRLQGYVGAPIPLPIDRYCVDGKDRDEPGKDCKITEITNLANMVRLGWYLSPLGVVLAVAGGLLLWWRVDRRTWLLLTLATIYTLFYVQSLYGTGQATYIYILRRYVPLVYPAFVLAMAVALGWLWNRPRRWRMAARSAALGMAALLTLFFVATGRTVYAHVEYEGALAQIEQISARIGPDDIVLVRGGGADGVAIRDTSDLVVAPLTYIYGRNAWPIKGTQPAHYADAFADQVQRWRDDGRRVYLLLSASGGDLLFPGFAPHQIDRWTLQLREFQQLPDQKPKLAYTNQVPWTLYELEPASEAPAISRIGYDDAAAQVAGFSRSEQSSLDEPRAAWTDGSAILRLPGAAQNGSITLAVAGGKRPQAIGSARLCVDLAAEPVPYPDGGVRDALPWQELQCATLNAGTTNLRIDVPNLQASGALLLRLRSETWVPAAVPADPGEPQPADGRRLGVRFMGLQIDR